MTRDEDDFFFEIFNVCHNFPYLIVTQWTAQVNQLRKQILGYFQKVVQDNFLIFLFRQGLFLLVVCCRYFALIIDICSFALICLSVTVSSEDTVSDIVKMIPRGPLVQKVT